MVSLFPHEAEEDFSKAQTSDRVPQQGWVSPMDTCFSWSFTSNKDFSWAKCQHTFSIHKDCQDAVDEDSPVARVSSSRRSSKSDGKQIKSCSGLRFSESQTPLCTSPLNSGAIFSNANPTQVQQPCLCLSPQPSPKEWADTPKPQGTVLLFAQEATCCTRVSWVLPSIS